MDWNLRKIVHGKSLCRTVWGSANGITLDKFMHVSTIKKRYKKVPAYTTAFESKPVWWQFKHDNSRCCADEDTPQRWPLRNQQDLCFCFFLMSWFPAVLNEELKKEVKHPCPLLKKNPKSVNPSIHQLFWLLETIQRKYKNKRHMVLNLRPTSSFIQPLQVFGTSHYEMSLFSER